MIPREVGTRSTRWSEGRTREFSGGTADRRDEYSGVELVRGHGRLVTLDESKSRIRGGRLALMIAFLFARVPAFGGCMFRIRAVMNTRPFSFIQAGVIVSTR